MTTGRINQVATLAKNFLKSLCSGSTTDRRNLSFLRYTILSHLADKTPRSSIKYNIMIMRRVLYSVVGQRHFCTHRAKEPKLRLFYPQTHSLFTGAMCLDFIFHSEQMYAVFFTFASNHLKPVY